MTRRGHSHRVVAIGFFGLLAVGLLVAGGIYVKYVRYERVADRHVPTDSAAVLRVDVEKVVWFEPLRKHFLPLVDELGAPARGRPRHERLRGRVGLDLAVDLREIVVSRGEAEGSWLIALGGLFPRSGVVAALGEVLREDGRTGAFEQALWRDQSGICFGQAADGVLLIGASCARVRDGLEATEAAATLGLARGVPVALVARGVLAHAPFRWFGAEAPAALSGLDGSALSGEPVRWQLELRAESAPEDAAARLAQGWGKGQDPWRVHEIGPPPRASGATVAGQWSRAEVDRLAANLAAALRERTATKRQN